MSDFMAVFLASSAVMLVVLVMFLLTLKKVMDLEKRIE